MVFQAYARLEFLTPKMLCSPSEVMQDIKNKAIVVKRGNCTFLEKAEIAQRLGAKLLLVASETSIVRSSFFAQLIALCRSFGAWKLTSIFSIVM